MLTPSEESILTTLHRDRLEGEIKLELLANKASVSRPSAWRAVRGLSIKHLLNTSRQCGGGPDSLLTINFTDKGRTVALWLQGYGGLS